MCKWCCLTVLVIGPAIVGCGGDSLRRVPVEGVLTAAGEPVEGATVQFLPATGNPGENLGGIGRTDAAGKFTLTSSRQGDTGLPAGEYMVRVTRLVDGDGTFLPSDAKEADHPLAKESIPQPYSGMASTLKATVPEGGGTVKVDIPAKLPGKKKS